jgi:hypothetical protein
MKIGVNLKIDVSKIDKSKLFKGQKGVYLDAVAFIDIDQIDQYGNSGMITQDAGKDSQEKGAILGNSKIFWRDGGQPQQQNQQPKTSGSVVPGQMKEPDFDDDSIPF